MLKIDVISGFLGAGKTTFIKRLLETDLKNEKVVLIENEYGEVSVDSDLLTDSNIEIKELSQGCICCSLVGDFSKSLNDVVAKFNPDRILIEPSGVGKLSDVVKAIASAGLQDNVNSLVCMVDAKKAKMYEKNFGEFFVDQIENAHTVILSRMDICKEENATVALEIIRKHNDHCVVVTTPIATLSDEELLNAYEGVDLDLIKEVEEEHEHHHHHHDHDEECCCGHHHHDEDDEDEHEHHHHHDHDEECCCGHHHHDEDDDDDDEDEHEHHHHHDHDEECCCGHHHHDEDDDDDEDEHEHHHHHHEHGEECTCGCHDHDHEHEHHHHHHADEVFTSVGIETVKKYDLDALKALLDEIAEGHYGMIVRSKGIIQATDGSWYVFNLTPEEVEVIPANPIPTGKIVVIGSHINTEDIKKLF